MCVFHSAGKKVYFTLLASSFMFPISTFAQCVDNEDCVSLGYNKTSCKTPGLKCPFGEYYWCPKDCEDGYEWKDGACQPKELEGAVLGQCTGYAQNCNIADILNSDGTCTSDKVSGKTPIGVVVYISGGTDKCGYAMTASPITIGLKWSIAHVNTGAFQSSNWQEAIKDFDVSGNMTKIIQSGNSSTCPAAYAALNYAPSVAPTSKGKWMLPTAGILNSLYTNLNAVNNTISKLGGTQLVGDNEHIWSSSEYNNYLAWVFCTSTNGGVGSYNKNSGTSDYVVRPVLAF